MSELDKANQGRIGWFAESQRLGKLLKSTLKELSTVIKDRDAWEIKSRELDEELLKRKLKPYSGVQKELDAAVEYHDHCGNMVDDALDGDDQENINFDDMSRFEGYACRIKRLVSRYKNTRDIGMVEEEFVAEDQFIKVLEEIHATLQGDLSHDKVGAVKKKIKSLLG